MQDLSQFEVGSSEYIKAANQNYYQRNKEKEKARTTKWRKDNQAWYKDWAEKNKEKRRANSRKYEYNIAPEEFDRKKAEQDSKCAVCKAEGVFLVVDHNHSCCFERKTCGKCNRGLLCRSCNTAIGLLKESEEILNSAIQYLRSHNGTHVLQ